MPKTPDLAPLEAFFSRSDRERAFSLMELQGLLFAFAGAPETVPFMEMFELACGGEEPVFASEEEARSVTGSFAALFNQINEGVLRREPSLPDGCVVRDDPMANLDPGAPLSRWSRGFREGFRYVRDDWSYWLPDELDPDLDDELAASITILTLFASRESAEAFREDLEADGTTLERVAESSVRLFPDAMATYAGLGRGIHEARLRLGREGSAGPDAGASADPDRSPRRSAGGDTPPSELFELLLDLPEPEWDSWMGYGARGVTPSHEAELIGIATDLDLLDAEDGSPEGWAPIHACRCLGELRSEGAVTPLLEALGAGTASDDWLAHDLPAVFAAVGPSAIDPLIAFAADRSRDESTRMTAVVGLGRIALRDEAAREACVAGMTEILEGYADDDPYFNAVVVGELVDLEAREAAPLIRAAFDADRVDPAFMGDWEDVQIELGLLTERRTPRASMDDRRRWRPTRAKPLPGWRSIEPRAVEVLERSLGREGRLAGTISPRALEGFLFAVACAPDLVPPSAWIGRLLDDAPELEDEEEAAELVRALVTLYGKIQEAVNEPYVGAPEGLFRDDLMSNLEEDSEAGQWSSGFLLGHGWLEELWEVSDDAGLEDMVAEELAPAMLALSFFVPSLAERFHQKLGGSEMPLAEMAETIREGWADALTDYAALGRTLFRERMDGAFRTPSPARAEPKPGRNDPCPCGSGRKYKKCCGAGKG